MHSHDIRPWTHDHAFDPGNPSAERGTRAVMWITAAMMLVEIAAGWWFNSMALLADGLHMSSHALAIGLSAFAYASARRHAHDPRFAFGSWKIEVLAGFTSAIFLLAVALLMLVGSVERLLDPKVIGYQEAIAVAVVGLVVNLVCALILAGSHGHAHEGGHDHHRHDPHHDHPHHDLNLRSAYLHVVADAATSVLAIIALTGALLLGWNWLDPLMGVVGALLVARWARHLIRDTSRVLLDREMDHPVAAEIHDAVARIGGETTIADLHLWRVGRSQFACILSVVTHDHSLTPARVKQALAGHEELAHITVEIQHCTEPV